MLGQTLEILCAYVRKKRPRTKETDEQPAVPLPTDVKLTLQVISRLNRLNEDGKIPVDLSLTDLQGADFGGANLARVNFSHSNLTDVDLRDANLQRANLWDVDLTGADLDEANLQGANLMRTNLRGASFWNANLQGAIITGTILEKKADAGG